MSETAEGGGIAEAPAALYLLWAALTDEMDAPAPRSPQRDTAAVRRMKQAAAEWLTVVDRPAGRSAYLDRWVHDECGYQRAPH